MPIQRLRLSPAEYQGYRAHLTRLETLGIPVGDAVDLPETPDRFTLEQSDHELPLIYQLALSEVVVIAPAKLTVRKSGVLITATAMLTPWGVWPLDLSDPDDSPHCKELIGKLYHPPTFLNDWLMRTRPLRSCQVEGVIIAHGYVSVPSEVKDGSLVRVELLLEDERRNELSFPFIVELNRSVVIKRMWRELERRKSARSIKGRALFAPKGGNLREEKCILPAETNIKHIVTNATGDVRTPRSESESTIFSKRDVAE